MPRGRKSKQQQYHDTLLDLLLSTEQVMEALSAYHKERPEGEGLAFPMMEQARNAVEVARRLIQTLEGVITMDLVDIFAGKLSTAPLEFFESESGRRLQAKMLRTVRKEQGKDAGRRMRNEITVSHSVALLMPA